VGMEVSISTQGGNFTANLKLPRTLVLSLSVTIGGLIVNAVHTELKLRDVQHELAECKARIDAHESGTGVQ